MLKKSLGVIPSPFVEEGLTLFDMGREHDGPQNVFDHCAQMLNPIQVGGHIVPSTSFFPAVPKRFIVD